MRLAVETMEKNSQCMDDSMATVEMVSQSFLQLLNQIAEIKEQSAQITSVLNEQADSSVALEQGLSDISSVSEENVRVTQETLLASVTVKNIAGEINSLLHRFATDARQLAAEDKTGIS
ncbi:hypothetical protein P4S72_24130 [Vibrio sp. PP-XX7]